MALKPPPDDRRKMASVDDLIKDQTIRNLVNEVTTRFIQTKQPTPKPHFYKKLQGRGDLISDLVRHEFLA
jgi:hypothetical protein